MSVMLCIYGCTDYEEMYSDDTMLPQTAQTRAMQFSLDDAVYHRTTDSWIVPQPDPYALDNVERAYDNLISGKAMVDITSDMVEELSSIQLSATHYNVKIYPKTEAEQMRLETTSDIVVSYIPFDYVQLPYEATEHLAKQDIYLETPRYTETHDDFVSTEGPVEPFTVELPVLYAVWPCDKQFPSDMDYETLNEVFIPEDMPQTRSGNNGLTAMQLLEYTAITQVLDNQFVAMTMSGWGDVIFSGGTATGGIFNSDNVLGTYAPVPNVKVRYQLGSKTWETYTDESGKFRIEYVLADANLSFIFQTDKWKLTRANSTAAYTISRGKHGSGDAGATFYGGVSIPVMETQRAIDFYYNRSHAVPVYSYESGIRVIVLDTPYVGDTEYVGMFTYSEKSNAYIQIANRNDCGKVIGTVLHEFGHWAHYGIKQGKYFDYKDIHKLIKESWASYVGWYLGEAYYKSLGWIEAYVNENITGQSRQGWNYIYSSWYSPLFIDLRDDHNQNGTDGIKDVPCSTITAILKKSTDWPTCRAAIQSELGNSYSSTVLNSFFIPYDGYIDAREIRVSPNPITNNTLIIALGGGIAGDGNLQIYDEAARLVYSTSKSNLYAGLKFSVTIPSFASGVYTVILTFTGDSNNPTGQAKATFVKL